MMVRFLLLAVFFGLSTCSGEFNFRNFDRGTDLGHNLKLLMQVLDFPMTDLIMTYPLNADGRASEDGREGLETFRSSLSVIQSIVARLSKTQRKALAQSLEEVPQLHEWRRATGLLVSNLVNNLPEDPELRSLGIELVESFVSFARSVRTGRFMAHKQLRLFEQALDALRAAAAQCTEATPSPDEVDYDSSHSSRRKWRNSFEHRPKKCAVCKADRVCHHSLSLPEMVETVTAHLLRGDKKSDCKSFFEHVSDLIHFWAKSVTPELESFCRDRGENLLKYLSVCREGERKFTSVILAVKFGRICQPYLSAKARQSVLPSMLISTLTPIAHEGAADFDPENSHDGPIEFWGEEIEVRSDPAGIVADSLEQLRSLTRFAFELPLIVAFENSPAEGSGARREWSARFMESILNVEAGWFQYSDPTERYFIKPTALPASQEQATERLVVYRMIGRVMAISIMEKQSPAAALTPGAVALLLEKDKLSHAPRYLEQESLRVYTSLVNLVAATTRAPVEDAGLTFANGEEVTTQNAHRYIEQETRRIVFESIQLQMHAIATGFYEVLSYGSTAYLTVDEVLNVLRGEPNIDINDLRASTTYTPSSTVNEHTIYIVWFWDIVYDFSQDERRDLVQFVSGSPLTPIDGFTGSERNREWFQIAFDDGLTLDQVPQAQTCFKQIRIPRYTSSEIMRTRLLMAIQNAKTLERA